MMDKQNEKTPLWKETAKVLTKAEMLNEDELQQVSGGDEVQQVRPGENGAREQFPRSKDESKGY